MPGCVVPMTRVDRGTPQLWAMCLLNMEEAPIGPFDVRWVEEKQSGCPSQG